MFNGDLAKKQPDFLQLTPPKIKKIKCLLMLGLIFD